jgi:hypothetical protein
MPRALCIALVTLVAQPALAAGEIGWVKSVTGSTAMVRGTASLGPLRPGQLLLVRDLIVTGKDGSLGVTFIDGTRFAVGPNTRLALSQFEFSSTTHRGSSLTTVDRGSLAVVSGQVAKENRDAMKVRTPTSLLAARGTRFVVEVK